MNQIKNLKWTPEEQKVLRDLRQIQIKDNVVDWEQIAEFLNSNFPKAVRTSKQCRQKYINHARLEGAENLSNWNEQELLSLIHLYEEFGPSWAYFSTKIINRSQNSLKNKFNNGLRKISKILYNRQGELYKHTKKSITTEMLIAMIDFVNQLQKSIIENDYTINLDSKFFSFRSQILRLSLLNHQASPDEIQNLIRKIKALNCKIRCFGIFKVKNRKNWKLSKRGLWNVCQYDNVINQNMSILQDKSSQLRSSKNERKTQIFSTVSFGLEQKYTISLSELDEVFDGYIKHQHDFDHGKLDEQIKEIFGLESQVLEFGSQLFN